MLLKCCIQYANKFGELSSGHRTGKGQFSSQTQRRTMSKNVQTAIQLWSFHRIMRLCSKSFKLGFSSIWTENFQMYKLGFEEVEEPASNFNICWIMEKEREFQKNIYFCFIDYAKAFHCVDDNKLENSWRWEYQTTLPTSWETCMQAKKQQLELDMKQGLIQNWERSITRKGKNWERSITRLYIVTVLI